MLAFLRSRVFPVLMVNFIGMMGYSLIIPILVFLVQDFGGNEFIYGILGSIYPAFQLIGAPLLGRWSDEVGRKWVLIISQAGTFLAWILFIVALLLPRVDLFQIDSEYLGAFALSTPLIVLFVARALDGLTGGNVSVANAYLADISTDENRKSNFGLMASSTSLGFILGPALAGILSATILGTLLPVIIAAVISMLAIFVISRFLPESNPNAVDAKMSILSIRKLFHIEHKECYEMTDCPDTTLRSILRTPGMPILFFIYFFNFLGFSFFYAGFPIFASTILEWSPAELGIFLTVSSLIMVIFQGPVLTYLGPRISEGWLVMIGSLLIGLSFVSMTFATTAAVYLANVLLSIGNGIMWPSFLSIFAQRSDPSKQGTIMGYGNSTGSLASIFGLILGGILFSRIGPSVFFLGATLLFCITVASVGLVRGGGEN
ncbi:MAG: MFS transporter [Bacteroidota bacterium]